MIELRLKIIYPNVSPKQGVKGRIERIKITKTIPSNLHQFSVGDAWFDSSSSGTCLDVLIADKLSVVQYLSKN